MSRTTFHILDYKTKEDILGILDRLGKENLAPSGHGYEIFGSIPIKEAAEQSTLYYSDAWKIKPAIGLISVVLAANRDYNVVVEPNLRKIQLEEPNLNSFLQLSELMSQKSQKDFYTFWGHRDEKKYNTLRNLLVKIEELRKVFVNAEDDFDLMNKWGKNADVLNYQDNIIGSIPNIAIATFQHLRMVFGVDTVKPDQRVKELLTYEFGLTQLSDKKAIKAVEQIAEISGLKVITIDQIFVKYGSSYNNQKINKLTLKEIIQRLKSNGVSNEIISNSTNLSVVQIERI